MLTVITCRTGDSLLGYGNSLTTKQYWYVVPNVVAYSPGVNMIKGEIVTEKFNNSFNNCSHVELYGTVSLPFEGIFVDTGKATSLPLGLSYIDRRSKYASDYCTVTNFNISAAGFREEYVINKAYTTLKQTMCVIAIGSVEGSKVLMNSYSSYAADGNIDAAFNRANKSYLDAVASGAWATSKYVSPTQAIKVTKGNRLTQCLAQLKALQTSLLATCPGPSLVNEHDEDVFTDALNSLSDIPTLSIAAQVGIDGLIAQCLPDIASKLGSLVRGSKIQNRLRNLAEVDLAVNYGVLAPFSDYKDLFETCAKYNSEGMKPFWTKCAVGSRTYTSGKWTSRITCGISWDWKNSSIFEDTFALIHQAGLDLMPSQVWDLVPFSFAVDWLVNFSNLLEQLDAKINAQRYPVEYTWRTHRSEIDYSIYGQQVHCVVYQRVGGRNLPDITIDIEKGGLRGTLSSSNLKEAISLVMTFLLR